MKQLRDTECGVPWQKRVPHERGSLEGEKTKQTAFRLKPRELLVGVLPNSSDDQQLVVCEETYSN